MTSTTNETANAKRDPEIHEALEALCVSLDDSCPLMQNLARNSKAPLDISGVSAGLTAQERLKRLCKLLGHATDRKLTGTKP